MRISAMTEILSTETKKVDNTRKSDSVSKSKAFPSDKTELSSDSQKLSETNAQIDSISTQLASEPDIRSDKVDEVKEKIKNGYYDSSEFVDKLADKLMQDLNITSSET
jgi:flagellar biosynthesis anti-sigma factor FlgM